MDKVDHGIEVNGININNLRYADDTVLIAASQEKQQILISRVIESCNKYGLRLNTSKTKVMVDSKTPILLYYHYKSVPTGHSWKRLS